MKHKVIVETEDGDLLLKPDDGFVLWGNLYKGDGEGGLLGSSCNGDRLEESNVVKTAYTNFQFLESLYLPDYVFEQYLAFKNISIPVNTN